MIWVNTSVGLYSDFVRDITCICGGLSASHRAAGQLLPSELAQVPTHLTKPLAVTKPEYGGDDDDNGNNNNPLKYQPTKPLHSKFTNILNIT
jgi:hypothetical protein